MPDKTRRDPAVRTLAMPTDTNPAGDIFGGWLLSQMDVAGGTVAYQRSGGRVATIAVEAMKFYKPVYVGDLVSCYAEVVRIGNSSMAIQVDAWSDRRDGPVEKVTEAEFTFVAIDEKGRPRPVPRNDD